MLRIRSKKWVFCCSWVLLIIFCSLLVYTPVATAAAAGDIQNSMDKLLGYYNREVQCNDWEALGLRWAGVECSSKYTPENAVSASDYARKIMGAIAGRQDATGIQDDIDTLIGMQKTAGDTKGSFINGANTSLNQTIWAVIALDFADINGFTVNYQRDDAVSYICSNQDAGGGFDESGWGVDVDSTAHALIALSSDYQQPGKDAITTTINSALAYLQGQQMDTGGFGGWGSESPDTIAAVIEALMALGIDPSGKEWCKNGNNMINSLLSYQSSKGWFVLSWEALAWNDPTVPNQMSTYHSLLALGDLARGQSKYSSTLPEIGDLGGSGGNPGTVDPGQQQVSFSDLAGFDWAREAIESLAVKGIIKGTGDGYEPARNISRAEMLALLLRIQGINLEKGDSGFTDVMENDWFYTVIATAGKQGWVSGYPDSTFKPYAHISRNEAACLIIHIFPADTGEAFSGKVGFSDQENIPAWAWEAAGSLQQRGIISGYPDGSFRGEDKLTRAEAAVIVYKLIRK